MLERVKAIYYPNLTLQLSVTRFGSKKLLEPKNPYEKPLMNDKILVKIDKLECLKELWGAGVLIGRDNVYKLVSGDTDDDTYRQLMVSYYKTHASFANYVDSIVMFGSQSKPVITRFVESVRRELNRYQQEIDSHIRQYHGSKFLLEDNEYLYYAVLPICDLSALKGVERIV